MFIWKYSEEVSTEASASEIWAQWQDTATWPRWDKELEWVRLNGDFVKGTSGKMKPASGPEVEFILEEVIVNKFFSDSAKLPLTRLVFEHEYIPSAHSGDGAKIRHTVTMTGILAPLFGRVIGSKIRLHLRDAMTELTRCASTPHK